jgi:hypothetical protein
MLKFFFGNFRPLLLLGLGYTAIIFALNQSQGLIFGKPHFSAYKTLNRWVIWGEIWKDQALSALVSIFSSCVTAVAYRDLGPEETLSLPPDEAPAGTLGKVPG